MSRRPPTTSRPRSQRSVPAAEVVDAPIVNTHIGAGDRVLIVGKSGSGKSTAASRIAADWSRVLVFDPKFDPVAVLPNSAVRYGVDSARRALPGRVIYRPLAGEQSDLPGAFDVLVREVLRHGGACGIVLHETRDVAPSSGSRRHLSAAIRQGRSLRVPIVFVAQRPAWIDVLALSEPDHVYLFTLQFPTDVERMAPLLGVRKELLTTPEHPHGFYYRGPGGECYRLPPLKL